MKITSVGLLACGAIWYWWACTHYTRIPI